jgi:DNA (cytosine-5)-methyltransferase 1
VQKVRLLGNIYGENFGTGYAGNVYDSNYLSPTLTNMQGGGRQPMIIQETISTKEKKRDIASTILNGYGNNHILSQYRIRKLTPKECWRLMGFTDEEFEKAAAVNSNTQLYKQAGNSIVVDVLVAIFSEMINSLENKTPKYQHMEQMSLFDYE